MPTVSMTSSPPGHSNAGSGHAHGQAAAGENTPGYERTKEMFRTPNTEKLRQIKVNSRTVVATVVFLVLLGAAMLFIAIAGHV
jgi:hypothetical protein